MLVPKVDETVRVEATSIAQPQYMRERLVTDSASHNLVLATKPMSSTTTVAPALKIPSPLSNALSLDWLKQEQLKGSSSNSADEAKMPVDGAITKKKVKRKPEQELDGTYFHPEKLPAQMNEERQKSHMLPTAILPQKLNLPSAAPPPPNFEQSS